MQVKAGTTELRIMFILAAVTWLDNITLVVYCTSLSSLTQGHTEVFRLVERLLQSQGYSCKPNSPQHCTVQ